jgi:DNA-binding PadR family transcriptional regulator
VYPVLQQLQDEGLVTAEESEGRRVFALTEAGRRLVAENPAEYREPWAGGDHGRHNNAKRLFEVGPGLFMAVREVVRTGDDAQIEAARAVLEDARKALYRILAGDAPASEGEQGPAQP